jgi:hypothetical protein
VEISHQNAYYPFSFMFLRSGEAFAMSGCQEAVMKSKLLAVLLFAGSSLFAAPALVVGVGIGAPPPARVAVVPVAPGPGYAWVGGYWYPAGARWAWRGGYWARPPYARGYWAAPRYFGGRYYRGYWRR